MRLVLALFLASRLAAATSPDEVLKAVDEALASTKTHGRRVPAEGSLFCADRNPGVQNRRFLCDLTERVGAWSLENLRADGGALVGAQLEIRRFRSPDAARTAKETALERFGDGNVGWFDGALSWCYLEVPWTADLLVSLEYGCHISLPHVKTLGEVRRRLLALGEPFDGTRAIGLAGSHSGWSWLEGPDGKPVQAEKAQRFRHFARVVKVAADDVLHVRRRPDAREEEVAKLRPSETCVPIVLREEGAPWWRVRAGGQEGWANAHFLEEQPAAACRGR